MTSALFRVMGTGIAVLLMPGGMVWGQGHADPAQASALLAPPVNRLTEQFIWTAGDAAASDPALQARVRGPNDKTDPHYLRGCFKVQRLPRQATLYLAGPRAAAVYINGRAVLRSVDDPQTPKGLNVLTANVAAMLQRGENVIAIEAVRGRGSLHTGADATINQVTYGEVLVAKIVPRTEGVDARPLLVSNGSWRSVLSAPEGWQAAGFRDAQWPLVQSLGALGSKRDFLQWNADAGLYAWPGYAGISSQMRIFPLRAAATEVSSGEKAIAAETVDFGREFNGRVRIASSASKPVQVTISYGESREEAESGKNYLGTRKMLVPAHGVAFGPKSGLRYVRVTGPGDLLPALHIAAQGITYPVRYLGSFESSDAKVNRIWETAAYTARLCLQEGIWDGVKRDRGRWMGDLDVTGRTISTVFGERPLIEQTMEEIIGKPPVTRDINTIVGYSALWITGQAEFYRHSGDARYLRKMRAPLLSLLALIDNEIDADGVFRNHAGHKIFVDWSEGLSSDTAEARTATGLELTTAYGEAAFLLQQMGDADGAAHARMQAEHMRNAARGHLLSGETFGPRWQTNAIAILSGTATAEQRDAIWQRVLAHIGEGDATITPYYGYYVLSAMAELGHEREALEWMRLYWGGMLDAGATSFWEAYDPHSPKQDFHAYLRADGKQGYYVSLAHGWASGPAPWLIERILGIRPTGAGFREVTIAPELAGLTWARGGEPTPRGLLHVEVRENAVIVMLPPATRATLYLPFPCDAKVLMNGHPLTNSRNRNGRLKVVLEHAGTYRFRLL